MAKKATPMIHVPDVRATVDWYKAIGFTVGATYDDGGEGLSFAILSFGSGEVMFSSGGQRQHEDRSWAGASRLVRRRRSPTKDRRSRPRLPTMPSSSFDPLS